MNRRDRFGWLMLVLWFGLVYHVYHLVINLTMKTTLVKRLEKKKNERIFYLMRKSFVTLPLQCELKRLKGVFVILFMGYLGNSHLNDYHFYKIIKNC